MRHATGTDYNLSPISPQKATLFLTGFISHHKNTMISLNGSRDSQPMTSITTGWLNNGPSGTEQAQFLTIFDHSGTNTILHTTTRIEHLYFCQNQRRNITGDAIQAYKRSASNRLQNGMIIVHFILYRLCVLVHNLTSLLYRIVAPHCVTGNR